jgi:hypothetical protein
MKQVLMTTPSVRDVARRVAHRVGPRSGEHSTHRTPEAPDLVRSQTMPPPTGPPALAYNTFQAAKVAGICRSLLYREIAAGRLIARKHGRRTIILDTDLRAWLAALPRMSASGADHRVTA